MAEEAENPNAEVAFTASPTAGLGVRAKGYRLVDLLFILGALGLVWGAWELKAHAGDSATQSAAIVKAVTESNNAIVQALKEQQAVAKESNAQTVRVLERLTRAQAEANCLLDPMMKNRADAREFCKRISGRDDR